MTTTRRAFIGGLAAVSAPGAAAAREPSGGPITRRELEHYYAFLWAEHCAVAELLGVSEFDAMLVHKSGGIQVYSAVDSGHIPKRAKVMLGLAG